MAVESRPAQGAPAPHIVGLETKAKPTPAVPTQRHKDALGDLIRGLTLVPTTTSVVHFEDADPAASDPKPAKPTVPQPRSGNS
jgi:hypothetical protein